MLYAPQSQLEAQTIIRGRNRYHPPSRDCKTGLSISCMFNGEALYETARSRYLVGDGTYLLLNGGTDYRFSIDSPTPVESLSIAFPSAWLDQAWDGLCRPLSDRLDQPESPVAAALFETVYERGAAVGVQVERLRAALDGSLIDEAHLEEHLRLLLDAVVAEQEPLWRQSEALPAARPSTRVELHRRLYLARDYILGSFERDLRLPDMAAVAALAPHHFLRSFKRVFGLTPHAFVVQRRLDRARFLLRSTDMPIKQICAAVGFASAPSFTALFRRHCGLSPRAYRQQKSNSR